MYLLAGKLRDAVLYSAYGAYYPTTADQRKILGAIGSALPGKSLISLEFPVAPGQNSLRDVVHALTGPNATHTLEQLTIDGYPSSAYFEDEDPAASPWALATIPTLTYLVVDGYPSDVITRSQVAILEDALLSRRRSGHPPLRTIGLGRVFSDFAYIYSTGWDAEQLREYAALLQRMWAVAKSESPTSELKTEHGGLEELIADCLAWADKIAQAD